MSSEIFRGNSLVKAHDSEYEYIEQEIKEYAKCKKNALYFIENYIKIINLNDGLVNFKLYPYQKKMLRALQDNNRLSFNCSRQLGKSALSAAFLMWYALFHNNKTIALVANKAATAREIFSRIALMLENIPFFLQCGTKYLNKGSLELSNGSRIITAATSASSIRGFSIDILFCVSVKSLVTVRNKKTGDVETITMDELQKQIRQS